MEQAVSQLVGSAQTKPPAQVAAVPALQVPPPQVLAGVNTPFVHDAESPHCVPAATCAHAPPAPQKPLFPQTEAVHCPAGAVVPAAIEPHVPSEPFPFASAVHAWQVPSQAELQQTPLAQKPLAQSVVPVQAPPFLTPAQKPPLQLPLLQSVPSVHAVPSAQVSPSASQVVPPQSVPVSFPFITPSVHVGTWQTFGAPLQTPLLQSPPLSHICKSWQVAPHDPPQSTSVSFPSWTPSVQLATTHRPCPLQLVPPLSVHAVPVKALVVAQQPRLHSATTQPVSGGGHAVDRTQDVRVPHRLASAPLSVPPSIPASVPDSLVLTAS